MKRFIRILILALSGLLNFHSSPAQYNNYKATIQMIEAMVKEYPAICSARSLVKTEGGREIMVLTIGTGEVDNKPGIAVTGGIEGIHILGKELSLGFARSLWSGFL